MKTLCTMQTLSGSLLASAVLAFLAEPAAAQPCFPAEDPEPPCCFSADRAPPPCPAPGADCHGTTGRCLAAKGTWWAPGQEGIAAEVGTHLRWTFNLVPSGDGVPHPRGLTFPRGGFEIFRRRHQDDPSGEQYPYLSYARVYPATTLEEAIARIPASLAATDPEAYQAYLADRDCNDAPDLEDLLYVVKLAFCEVDVEGEASTGYSDYWWLEGSKNPSGSSEFWRTWRAPFPPPPEFDLRYDDYFADRERFFEKYGREPMGYGFKPLETLLVASVDPVIARILGFYFVDHDDGELQHDYMIVAHYLDREPPGVYCAEVLNVGSRTYKEVPAPAELTVEEGLTETTVNLTWPNYLKDVLHLPGPDSPLLEEHERDVSLPLRYVLSRREGERAFEPLLRRSSSLMCGEELTDPECGEPSVVPEVTMVRVPPVLIGRKPRPGGDRDDPDDVVWKDPPYYRDTTVAEGEAYAYQVRGVDLFGRYSAAAESAAITVVDRVAPPTPVVTEAKILQIGGPEFELLPDKHPTRENVLAEGAAIVLRMRWLWPESYRADHPDLERFFVFQPGRVRKIVSAEPSALTEDYPSTPPSGISADGTCDDGEDNDGDGLVDLDDPGCDPEREELRSELPPACSDGEDNDGDGCVDYPDDDGCEHASDPNEDDARAERFEAYVGLDDIAEPVSEDSPDDAVRFYEFGVAAVDRQNNPSSPSRLWKVAVRDVTPPGIPGSPRPVGRPSPPDAAGLSAIALEWDTSPPEPYVTYHVYRIDRRSLCKAAGGGDCSDEDLLDHLEEHSEILALVSNVPLGPFPGAFGRFVDRVSPPARFDEEVEYLYVLQAMDPAGNRSDFSDPSEWIRVPDSFPPSKPVIARASGSPGVSIEWSLGPESDLEVYRLYRTDEPAHRSSKRKMIFLVEVNAREPPKGVFDVDTRRFEVLDFPPLTGRPQYYRLEVEDRSQNVSELSEWATVGTIDGDPPHRPAFTNAPAWRHCDGASPEIYMTWSAPRGAVATRLLRRRLEGAVLQDLSGWLPVAERPEPEHRDGLDSVKATRNYAYRLEARDDSGNISRSLVDAVVLSDPDCVPEPEIRFRRGDPNLDGEPDISDAVFILGVLFGVGGGGAGDEPPLSCEAAADVNSDAFVDISDPIYLLRFLFLSGPPPEAPFPHCGTGRSVSLDCSAPCK